jgi:hypothetical protein
MKPPGAARKGTTEPRNFDYIRDRKKGLHHEPYPEPPNARRRTA